MCLCMLEVQNSKRQGINVSPNRNWNWAGPHLMKSGWGTFFWHFLKKQNACLGTLLLFLVKKLYESWKLIIWPWRNWYEY